MSILCFHFVDHGSLLMKNLNPVPQIIDKINQKIKVKKYLQKCKFLTNVQLHFN